MSLSPALTRWAALLIAAAVAPLLPAQEKTAAKRTNNRGPESVELKFKLPPPPVLTPEQALKTFKLPKGYKIELVASEPMVQAPVSMSWDDQGRLYVCEMIGYMHDVDAKGEDQPIGRVSRLEDTDGDGKMDNSTVFVDKLYMPRSVTAFGDGVIIAEPPELVWHRDTDGDGVADQKVPVGSGYGTRGGQPEHMANSVTYTMDNWLTSAGYGTRYRYQGGAFISEPTRSGGQWGLTQDDWGRRYYNFNSDLLRVDMLPPQVYARNPNLTDRLALNYSLMKDGTVWPAIPTPGVNRGYAEKTLKPDGKLNSVTATCGPGIYRGDLFPAEFRGNAFIPEPAGNLVKRVILTEAEGTMAGRNATSGVDFLTSTDERFRPVNAYTGPDGALYIVDMARGVIQHRFFLTHYLIANIKDRNLEQPINLGRIYRIVPENATPKTVKLPKETAEIVSYLDHANGHIRDTAQRVLVERGDASVVDAVKKLVTEAKTPQGRVQALWTLEGLKGITPEVVSGALKDAHAKVRAAAVGFANLAHTTELLSMVEDTNAEVRVQLALQLSSMPGPEAQHAVMGLIRKGGSPFLNDAIACGIRGKELEYVQELLKEKADEKKDALAASGLLQMLANCVMNERRPARIQQLLELTASPEINKARQASLINGLGGIPLTKGAKPVQRKLIYLESSPVALTTLQKLGAPQKSLKPALEALDKALAWPNKPGVPPPPVVVPLNQEQLALFDRGKMLYAGVCAACHQPSGLGMEGLAPPLVDSEWVTGKADIPARIILHGMSGPVNVSGRTWNLEMPPLPIFTDDDVAAILTYIRREWEHTANPVSPKDVAKIRDAHKDRTKTWTANELKPPVAKK